MRFSRQSLHMATAILWANRSLCKRNKVGAVIVSPDMRQVLSFGYNGPAKGLPNDVCSAEEGKCGCIHAEMNAIALVDGTIKDKVLFTTVFPCRMCAQLIVQANISSVFFLKAYRDESAEGVFNQCGVKPQHLFLSEELLSLTLRQLG